ncbi:MAG: ATP-binding cassette domain-containing protein [Rhodobacteraceae bacterium]|nr:ATP-binding cassette domain-containing protein [Paracoccaceae bacterium]
MSSQEGPLVQLTRAGVRQGDSWRVRGVDLTVAAGQIVTLIGPNGSGKSTTAKMALGILQPSEGEALRRKGLVVGYVPQKLHIDWTMPLTVSRFLELTNRLSKSEKNAALERTGVGHLLSSSVGSLSGGELQRVLLARAIARKPDLLVLDEPVQGVDYSGEIKMYDLISKMRTELGCGVLMISHDLHVVMAATDHVVCLNGHVCCRGTPVSVTQSDEFKSLFGHKGGAGAAGLAVYEHHHDHVHLEDGRVRHADGSISDDCAGEHCHGDHDHPHTAAKEHHHA